MTDELTAGIVQDDLTGQVLMLGFLDEEALQLTRQTGLVHFHSRSRDQLWKKGETSGNTLSVVSISKDCDGDALLIKAVPAGPTCHTGSVSCFGDAESFGTIPRLWVTILSRRDERPDGSYTVSLLEGGVEAAGRKMVEEAVEVLLAATDHAGGGPPERVAEEAADLVYHLMVLLAERGIELGSVMEVLDQRAR
ncbi:MAG TPA: bifunctional phosphoribosyl-AMP cyclohydrolase/phosphoribosyl-ATP diphosphatase HisIE [Acidimicrobiia bacterium]|nr:bifunctional phosphoribosyl-AMP cyclohydrolase/phosphoribosyl-ATP diphosphatase HisIE [Acidimicrobiia bacterium]